MVGLSGLVSQNDGGHPGNLVLGTHFLVLLNLLRSLLGLVAWIVELQQHKALGHFLNECILHEHVLVQCLAGRTPIGTSELHQDGQVFLAS